MENKNTFVTIRIYTLIQNIPKRDLQNTVKNNLIFYLKIS